MDRSSRLELTGVFEFEIWRIDEAITRGSVRYLIQSHWLLVLTATIAAARGTPAKVILFRLGETPAYAAWPSRHRYCERPAR